MQTGENEDEENEEEQEDLGKGFNGGNDKENISERVVGMIATSLQPSLKQKEEGTCSEY